jgi:cytoskeletal protein CcmA (bactofilin family)
VCGSARIEGIFNGHLRCEGEARLAMQKPCPGRISAGSVIIERKSQIDSAHPIEADQFAIEGKLRAPIKSRGIVRVLKGGWLEGSVTALSMVVEKGGVFVGDCRIQAAPKPAPLVEDSAEPSAENSES